MFTGATHWSAGYLAAGVLEDYLERGPAEDGLPPMPPALADLLRTASGRDPDDRPRDMREIAAVLQRLYCAVDRAAPTAAQPPQAAKALADSLNNRAAVAARLAQARRGGTAVGGGAGGRPAAIPNRPTTSA